MSRSLRNQSDGLALKDPVERDKEMFVRKATHLLDLDARDTFESDLAWKTLEGWFKANRKNLYDVDRFGGDTV